MHYTKRGISPVIATGLLVLLALVLAILIFLWAQTLIKEKIQKDIGNGPENIDNFCEQVNFKAEIIETATTDLQILVENNGNVPIYGVQVQRVKSSSRKTVGEANVGDPQTVQLILPSMTKTLVLKDDDNLLDEDNNVLIIPILVGTNDKSSIKQRICSKEFGITATVRA